MQNVRYFFFFSHFQIFLPLQLTRAPSEGVTCNVSNRSAAKRFNEKNWWKLWENHSGLALKMTMEAKKWWLCESVSDSSSPFPSRFLIPNLPTTPHEITADISTWMVTSIVSWDCRFSQIKGVLTDPLRFKEKFAQNATFFFHGTQKNTFWKIFQTNPVSKSL